MYRNSHVARVNNLEIRAIRPSNRSRRDLKGEMSRIKPRTRLLMSRRGEAEVVKCGRNTSTLTFTLNSHLLSGCPTTASQRGLRTRPRLLRIQKDFQKKKKKVRVLFFLSSQRPRCTRPSRGVRDTRTRHVARNGLYVSSRGHKVSAQESMKLGLETNGTK